MYALKPEAQEWEPIAGVPWRDMSDEEFAVVTELYDAQFAEKGTLSRFFEQVEDAGASRSKKSTAGHAGSGR